MNVCANNYDIGDLVILKNGTFVNSEGTAVDPGVINVKVQSPDYETAVYTYGIDPNIEKLAVGIYRCTIKPLQTGVWVYRWEAVDPAAALVTALEGAEERRFYVRPSAFVYGAI
jgi:hypothetical protein